VPEKIGLKTSLTAVSTSKSRETCEPLALCSPSALASQPPHTTTEKTLLAHSHGPARTKILKDEDRAPQDPNATPWTSYRVYKYAEHSRKNAFFRANEDSVRAIMHPGSTSNTRKTKDWCCWGRMVFLFNNTSEQKDAFFPAHHY